MTARRVSEDYLALAEIMPGALDEIEAIGGHGGGLTGVPTGFADLDALTHALRWIRTRGRLGDVMLAARYPADGLVLTDITRALPYEPEQGPRYEKAIASHPIYAHLDHVWYRKHEARQFLPDRFEPGQTHQVPRPILERLVRFHLGTNTDTIAGPFGENTIKEAWLIVQYAAVACLEAAGRKSCKWRARRWWMVRRIRRTERLPATGPTCWGGWCTT